MRCFPPKLSTQVLSPQPIWGKDQTFSVSFLLTATNNHTMKAQTHIHHTKQINTQLKTTIKRVFFFFLDGLIH